MMRLEILGEMEAERTEETDKAGQAEVQQGRKQ